MKKLAVLAAAALACACASADTVGLHLGSYHPGRPDLNPINPGAYVRTDKGWTAGAYVNSIKRISAYAGRTFSKGRFSVTVGAITGYEGPLVQPLVVPSIYLGKGFRVVYVPQFEKAAQTIHLTYEWSIN